MKMKKHICRWLILMVLLAVVVIGEGTMSEAATGKWRQNSKGWYYQYSDGTRAKSAWVKSGNKWYHFNKYGYMQLGWQKLSGKWYYFGKNGVMRVGWQKIGGKWYFFGNGVMQTGWKKLSGKWYFFESSGAMKTGWKKLSGKWYYFDSEGRMVTGKRTIGGGEYVFNSSGVMIQDAKYYNLYKPFLNDVKNTVLRARNAGTWYSFDYTSELETRWGLCFYTDPTYGGFSYAFEDLNKDGTPELLLFLGISKNEREIAAGFTIVNGKMKSFMIGWARNEYWICKDGYIYNLGNSGGQANSYTKYKMGKSQLTVVDNVCEDWGTYFKAADGNLYTTGKKTTISKAEFTRVSEAWYKYATNTKNQKDVAAITLVKPY